MLICPELREFLSFLLLFYCFNTFSRSYSEFINPWNNIWLLNFTLNHRGLSKAVFMSIFRREAPSSSCEAVTLWTDPLFSLSRSVRRVYEAVKTYKVQLIIIQLMIVNDKRISIHDVKRETFCGRNVSFQFDLPPPQCLTVNWLN